MSTETAHTGTGQIKKLVSRLRGAKRSASHDSLSRFGFLTPRRSQSPESNGNNRTAAKSLDVWNAAYDSLRDDPSCAGLVRAYENIISQELPDHLKLGGLHSSFRGKTPQERLDICMAIASAGLQKRRGSRCADDMPRLMLESAKGQVDAMAYASRSLAWAGFCTLTPLMLQAIVRREVFRAPLIHIVGRLSFYMDLAALLTPVAWTEYQHYYEMQHCIRDLLVRLYRKLLELEMNSVCATASTWNNAAKNVVAWNALPELGDAIKSLDARVVRIIQEHGAQAFRENVMGKYADLEVSWRSSEEARAACVA